MGEDVVTGLAPCNVSSGWIAVTLYTGSPPELAPTTEVPSSSIETISPEPTEEATTAPVFIASPPVIIETWPDPAVTRIPDFSTWIFHFKFNQNVNRPSRPAFVKVYYCIGFRVFSIDASADDNVHFPAPDTMQVVVPATLKALLARGQVFHVLLDEGVVTGPGPRYAPSAAVTDPDFYKVLYSGLVYESSETPYYTTPAPPSSCSDTERPTIIQSWPAEGFYSSDSLDKLILKYDQEVSINRDCMYHFTFVCNNLGM
ncbi:uncharacterized protein LOC119725434 [Patiria miniata]|uniref:Uncharacterized protein n=1 Tax=Patiria miniata TaxID=46514 RepID=A0A913ZLU3_PATMI|nr:uncharacterized protein LOC119725434 [Patiria miniata]